MDRLEPRRIKKHLIKRTRRRDGVELTTGKLNRNEFLGAAVAAKLEIIRPHRRSDRIDEVANDAIFIEALDCLQRAFDRGQNFAYALDALFRR